MAALGAKRWVRAADAALCVVVLGSGIAAVALHDDAPSGPCGEIGAPLEPAEVLDCLGDDLGHVTTAVGAGSAILLADGRLLTNAHVVDPFAAVDITFRDGATFPDTPVIGVDLQRDIAVLGPIERDGSIVLATQADIDALAQGDPLFLVGYPGELEDSVTEPTISQGILSRVRAAERFGQTFLQTDAAIGGGQSGGALVDADGRVVGISGLSFAENFALALASPDVIAGVDRIAAGQGSPYDPTGGPSATPTGVFTLYDDERPHFLTVPPADVDQLVHLEIDPASEPFLTVQDSWGEPLWLPRSLLDFADPDELDLDQATYDRLLALAGENDAVADFTVPAGRYAIVFVGTALPGGSAVTYSSSVPMSNHVDDDDGAVIASGSRTEGAIDAFELLDRYSIDLAEGQVVDIYVGAVAGDMLYAIYPAGGMADDTNTVDDSDEGLYGRDAHETFTAPAAGTYTIEIGTYEQISIGYVLEVQPG